MKINKTGKANKISLGHKHVWTDTSGHAHRVSFDAKTNGGMKPKTTAFVLVLVALLGASIGAALVLTAPKDEDGASVFIRPVDSVPSFIPSRVVDRSTEKPGSALVSGWNDEFFLADASGISLYDAKGEKLDFWANDEETAPTALAFCSEEQSAANGLLVVGYSTKVKAMRFSLEQYNLEEEGERAHTDDAVVRTAHNGLLGAAKTILTVEDADIRGLALAADRLFVADYAAQRVRRYSLNALEERSPEDKSPILPDCELGAPDAGLNFPGLKPAFDRNFCIMSLPSERLLLAANSGLFRIDSFDVVSGAWRSERSWAVANEFSGAANPIAIAPSTDGWVAMAEVKGEGNGDKPNAASPIRLFAQMGSQINQIEIGENSALLRDSYVVSLSLSSDSRFLYALESNGCVDVWTRR